MEILVKVTHDHIKQGNIHRIANCPIAKAIIDSIHSIELEHGRELNLTCDVGYLTATIRFENLMGAGKIYLAPLPLSAINFISMYDNNKLDIVLHQYPEGLSFPLNIPK